MLRVEKSIFLISLFLFFCSTFVFAEEITITTYYPSPYGVYKTMRLFPQGGFTAGAACANPGEMVYDSAGNQLLGCAGSPSVWKAFGGGRGISESGTFTIPQNTSFFIKNFTAAYTLPPTVFVTAQKNNPDPSSDNVMVWVSTVTNTSATIDLDAVMYNVACPGGAICSPMAGQHSYWTYNPSESINVNYMVISND